MFLAVPATELKLLGLLDHYPVIVGETAMATEKNLRELFHDTLKDIYFAEKKILSALPKMAKAAASEELKAAFEKHETETEEHGRPVECAGRAKKPRSFAAEGRVCFPPWPSDRARSWGSSFL
jgi:Domain of unknown function (DUF892)